MKTRSLLRWVLPPARVLRLTAYLTFTFLCCSAIAARVVFADIKEAAVAFGQQLTGLEALTNGEQVIIVNGERLHRTVAIVDAPIEKLLDLIQGDCESSPGLFGQVVTEAVNANPKRPELRTLTPRFLRGIVREDDERRGMVACFTDQRVSGIRGFAEAATRFAQSSDLSEFGRFRYAFAQKADDGKTTLTLLWADTGLNMNTMFPAVGDAAGEDSRALPRPKSSRRTLAAATSDAPYAIRLYETTETAAATRQFYDTWMKEHGWLTAGTAEADGSRSYLREDGYQVVVTITEGRERTSVALTEAGRPEGSIAEVQVIQ